MKIMKLLIAFAVIAGAGGFGFLYSGVYPMGADVPHYRLTHWLLDTLRERSIAAHIKDIEVPPLEDANLLLAGGADYNEMCTGCHMKPGQTASEISTGLYPQPPDLATGGTGGAHSDAKTRAARQFWIIKHGIKASGMAAFGKTHDDQRIWAMVAFLQKLPTLTPVQYQILTARSPDEEGNGGHMDMDMSSPTDASPRQKDSGHAH